MANTKLTTAASFVRDASGNNANAITDRNVAIFTPQIDYDVIPPSLLNWSLNLETSKLTLNISEDISSIDLSKLRITGVIDTYTLTTTHNITTDTNTLNITLLTADRDALVNITDNTTPVYMSGEINWSVDTAGNIAEVFNKNILLFTPTPDVIAPTITSWNLDVLNGTARFDFSEELSTFDPTKLTIKGTGITDYTLTTSTSRALGTSHIIDFNTVDATALSDLTANVLLDGNTNWGIDNASAANTGTSFSDLPVNNFIPFIIPVPPVLQSWSLDLDNGKSSFVFNININHLDVNVQDMNIAGINNQVNLQNSIVTSASGSTLNLSWNNQINQSIKDALNNAIPASLITSQGFVRNIADNTPHAAIIKPTTSTGSSFTNTLGIGKSVATITTQGITSVIPSVSIVVDNSVLTNTGQKVSSNVASESPNVATISSDIDLTQVIRNISTTKAAFVAEFSWGPENTIVNISSKEELIFTFGNPVGTHTRDFHTAINFLNYGNKSLDIVRIGSNATNQSAIATDALASTDLNNYIEAKYKGLLGNSIGVLLINGPSQFNTLKAFNNTINPVSLFDTAPLANEMHIVIYDATASITGNAGTILETYGYLSTDSTAVDADNINNYYKSVLESQSNYIKAGTSDIVNNININEVLTSGADATYSTNPINILSRGLTIPSSGKDALFILGLELFSDSGISDTGIFICGDRSITVQKYLHDMISNKADAVGIFSPSESATTSEDIINHFNTFNSSSYSIFISSWKRQLDTFNNVYITLPLDGDIAAILAQTDSRNDPWWSPAGYNRGIIKNINSLVFNPSIADRDNLFANRINPIIDSASGGILLFGDKTALSKPSSLDRINVRRLLNLLKKSIADAARYQLFEFNDDFTRTNFTTTVERYLDTIKTDRGIQDFKVIVSNDAQVIDSNQFAADIYIKPNRSINFIQLNFKAVGSGVDFNEVIDIVDPS